MKIDSIHFINLDRRPDRRAHIEACLAEAPVPPRRIAAIELTTPPEAQGIRMCRQFEGNSAIASIFLSHRKAVGSAIEQVKDGLSIVIEDDCHFPKRLWKEDLGLEGLPEDWLLAVISPRFRRLGIPDRRPRLTFWQRLNPFRERYWQKPLQEKAAKSTRDLAQDFIITGAHFLVFRNRWALETAIERMDAVEALYHVDHFFGEEMPGCYAVECRSIHAFGFGSDNKP